MIDPNYIDQYFNKTSKAISNLNTHKDKILLIIKEIEKCYNNKKKILVAGNGGSCSDAEHFAGELICTFNDRERKGISAMPLTSHSSAITAWANDFSFESYFERQIISNGQTDDILFLLSTGGGNLKNKASLISLVGKSGGELKKISDICIHVEDTETSIIQEAHMSILHCICIGLDKIIK